MSESNVCNKETHSRTFTHNSGNYWRLPGTESKVNKLTRPDYAYTPYLPRGQEHVKVPAWLNNPIYYHNRGNSLFRGEIRAQPAISSASMTCSPKIHGSSKA